MKTYKFILAILLLTISSLSFAKRHYVMVSDSRGNCAFALELFKNFHTLNESTFTFRSSGGSSPTQWIDDAKRRYSPAGIELKGQSGEFKGPKRIGFHRILTPEIKSYLENEFKDLNYKDEKVVIVNHGTNGNSYKDLLRDSTTMIEKIHATGAKCIWIGPPHNTKWDEKLITWQYEAIRNAIEKAGPGADGQRCQLINSLEISYYPFTARSRTRDLIHYCWDSTVEQAGRDWANKTFEQIKNILTIN